MKRLQSPQLGSDRDAEMVCRESVAWRRYQRGKRALDVAISVPVLIVTAPISAGVAVAIAVSMGRPVIFTQTRVGRNGKPFRLYKFRTMSNAHDSAGNPLASRDRITCLGRLLRRTSLDELPQLLNVILGEMSLVGPRPLLPEYLSLYTTEQQRRHEVKPGLTGWSQIRGRNRVDWDVRLAHDVWYVDHASVRLDLSILAKTAVLMVPRHGTSGGENEIMARFAGSQAIPTGDRP